MTPSNRSARHAQLPPIALGLVLAISSAVCATHPIHDADAFWHMTLGQAVLRAGARVVPEPVALEAFTEPLVVPEWLWGAATLGLYRTGGFKLLSLLPAVLAAACACALLALARTRQREQSIAASALVSGASLAIALSRMRLRPQAACLVLLPVFAWLAHRYARAPLERRARLGAALVAVELLWAQLHGSFVLAPLVFLIEAAGTLRGAAPRERQTTLWVALGLVLGLSSSAYGLRAGDYILAHGGGDATRHIADMMPPRWELFNPATHFYGPAYAGLWLCGLFGAFGARRLPRVELSLALLGALLGMSSVRFFVEGVALIVPWAVLGADALLDMVPSERARAFATWPCALLGLSLLANTTRAVDREYGPIGQLGFADEKLPLRAVASLARLPNNSPAVTAFSAGAPLGFLLQGRVRTYVDGRTPLYFDATDYALSRDVFEQPDALRTAAERYRAAAIVIQRDRPACTRAPAGFAAVAVDPLFTTFVRGGAASLSSVAACGDEFLAPNACADGGIELDAEIARLEHLRVSAFTRFLRAARIAACGGDPSRALSLLGDADEIGSGAEHYALQRRLLRGRLLVRQRALLTAFDLLERDLREGQLAALDTLGPGIVSGAIPLARVRSAIEDACETLDDRTPAYARNVLAHVCMAQGDADCVRFHGMRASISGEAPQFRAPLVWLTRHHPSARVREDAGRWLQALEQQDRSSAGGAR